MVMVLVVRSCPAVSISFARRRMYGFEEDAMTLFSAGAGAGAGRSMYHHDITAGEQADDDVLNLYGNGTADIYHEHQQVYNLICFLVFDFV